MRTRERSRETRQPRPQGFSLNRPFFKGKSPGDEVGDSLHSPKLKSLLAGYVPSERKPLPFLLIQPCSYARTLSMAPLVSVLTGLASTYF